MWYGRRNVSKMELFKPKCGLNFKSVDYVQILLV